MKQILNKQILSDIELSALRGGASSCYVCQCNGTGTWYGNYSSQQEAESTLSDYCSNYGGKGSCQTSNSTLCPAIDWIA